VDDYCGTYETAGRIENPGDEGCFSFPLRTMFSSNKMSTPHTFPHPGHPLTSVFCMRRLEVLLVDDDDGARLLYCYMLAAAGYKVNAVRNVLEAFAEIQVNRPDVIVTDIAMPVLSGLDLIVGVRSNDEFADLPVVAITSFGENLRE
jgi:PleD family two-component response regulator